MTFTDFKPKQKESLILLLFLCLGFIIQFSRFNEWPRAVHPWAQYDRYALAIGFLNNGFDLSKPETYLMNREFPHNFKKAQENSITAVNLPLHEYAVAAIMKVFNSRSVWIFQGYNFLLSFLGLFALFKIARLNQLSLSVASILVAFLFFCPVFLIYQLSFLNITNTLSFVLAGTYAYLLFHKKEKSKYFYLSVLFFTLATLIRSTALVPFIAVLITESFYSIKARKLKLSLLPPILISFTAFGLHYYYMNLHMVYHYGSVFLYYLVPAANLEVAKSIIKNIYELWLLHYLSLSQWILLGLLISFGSYQWLRAKKGTNFNPISLIAFFCFGGIVLFTYAMFSNFRDHDYYFIDTFLYPTLLFLILLLIKLEPILKQLSPKVKNLILVLIVLTIGAEGVYRKQKAVTEKPWQNTSSIIEDYRLAKPQIDALNIKENERLLIAGAEQAPNLPFILLDHKGYLLKWNEPELMRKVLDWPFDYFIFRKQQYFSVYHPKFPSFLDHFKVLLDAGPIILAQKTSKKSAHQIEDFFNYTDEQLLFAEKLDIEEASAYWSQLYKGDSLGEGKVLADREYSLTFKRKFKQSLPINGGLNLSLEVSGLSEQSKAQLVVTAKYLKSGKLLFYRALDLKDFAQAGNSWNRIFCYQPLNFYQKEETELAVYIWNRGFEKFKYRSVDLAYYRY